MQDLEDMLLTLPDTHDLWEDIIQDSFSLIKFDERVQRNSASHADQRRWIEVKDILGDIHDVALDFQTLLAKNWGHSR